MITVTEAPSLFYEPSHFTRHTGGQSKSNMKQSHRLYMYWYIYTGGQRIKCCKNMNERSNDKVCLIRHMAYSVVPQYRRSAPCARHTCLFVFSRRESATYLSLCTVSTTSARESPTFVFFVFMLDKGTRSTTTLRDLFRRTYVHIYAHTTFFFVNFSNCLHVFFLNPFCRIECNQYVRHPVGILYV